MTKTTIKPGDVCHNHDGVNGITIDSIKGDVAQVTYANGNSGEEPVASLRPGAEPAPKKA